MINRHLILIIGLSITLFTGATGCAANCYRPFSGDPIPGCLEAKWDREMASRGGEVGSISLSAVSDSLELGQMLVLSVDVRPPAGKKPPGPSVYIVWASSDSMVATVAGGSVFAKGVGVATISATAKGVVGTKAITVTAAHK
jgi:hypothetical protein